ncbi:hypothetical protein IT571_07780 [Candidatus Sumerlaeota bacterium]|nr:hypothetical protein [Candidatus Sumerlaeota bacterium]
MGSQNKCAKEFLRYQPLRNIIFPVTMDMIAVKAPHPITICTTLERFSVSGKKKTTKLAKHRKKTNAKKEAIRSAVFFCFFLPGFFSKY